MANNPNLVQFDELEGELELVMMEMAQEFATVDPAKEVGSVTIDMAEQFSAPYAKRFLDRLDALEMGEYDPSLIRTEFMGIIEEFDTVDRAVYARVDEQEPSQGIAVLIAEHKTKIMTHLQHVDEGYDG